MGKLIESGHKILALAITVSISVSLAFIELKFNHFNLWANFAVTGPVDSYFCEKACMDCLVREPINTWTNIPFLYLFFVFLLTAWKDIRYPSRINMLTYLPIYSFLFALGSFYMFIGSGFFHLSLTALGEQMDLSGVFFIGILPFIYNVHKAYNIRRFSNPVRTTRKTLVIFLGIFVLSFIVLTALKWHINTLLIVPALIILTALGMAHMEVSHPGKTAFRYLIYSGGIMVLGIICFTFDRFKIFCNETSWLQFHPLWHVLCAVSYYYLYLYLRSERTFGIYQFRIL